MPYMHEELKETPFQVLDKETKVGFDLNRLEPKEREAYKIMAEEILSKHYGEPYDYASQIFKEFETKQYKS